MNQFIDLLYSNNTEVRLTSIYKPINVKYK